MWAIKPPMHFAWLKLESHHKSIYTKIWNMLAVRSSILTTFVRFGLKFKDSDRLWNVIFTNVLVLIMAVAFSSLTEWFGFFLFVVNPLSLPPQSMSNLLKRLQEQVSVGKDLETKQKLTTNVIYSFPVTMSLTLSTSCVKYQACFSYVGQKRITHVGLLNTKAELCT